MDNSPQDGVSHIRSVEYRKQEGRIRKRRITLFWIGFVEIILGIISCVLGAAVAIEIHNSHRWIGIGFCGVGLDEQLTTRRPTYVSDISAVGQGMWCGAILMICGIAGMVVRCKTAKSIICFNVFISTVAALAMFFLMVMCSIAVIIDLDHLNDLSDIVKMSLILAVVALLGFFVALKHSCSSCIRTSPGKNRGDSVMYTTVPQDPLIPVHMPNGHVLYYPSQTLQPSRCYQKVTAAPSASVCNRNRPVYVVRSLHQTASESGSNPVMPPPYNTPVILMPSEVSTAPVTLSNELVTYSTSLLGEPSEHPPKYEECVQAECSGTREDESDCAENTGHILV